MSIKAILFDFDGTILDTETPEFESWCDVYAEYGCELPRSLWDNTIGRGKDQVTFDPHTHLLGHSKKPMDSDDLRIRRRALFARRLADEPLRPGIQRYILEAKARGLKLGVVSSSDHAWVEGHLQRFDLLSLFDTIRCADDVSRTKPDPELYLAALAAIGVHAHETVALEDSPNGALAAKQAGIFCIVTPNPMTRNLVFDAPDLLLESLEETSLTSLLEIVGNRIILPTQRLGVESVG